MILTLCLAILTMLLYLTYRSRKSKHNIFVEMGVPGPRPHWFWGNYDVLTDRKQTNGTICRQWSTKYGKTYGYYEGPQPVLATSDLEILKEVFVKQFQSFHGRKDIPVQPPDLDHDDRVHMFFARGSRWQRLRRISSPTFTASKLRQTSPLVNDKVDVLISKLEQKADTGENLNIHDYFQTLALDVIAEAAFGMSVNSQTDPKDPFLLACKKCFSDAARPIVILGTLLPEIQNVMFKMITTLTSFPFDKLVLKMDGVIKRRRSSTDAPERMDLIQLLLDAEVSDDDDEVFTDDDMSTQNKLTQEELKHQSVLFLLAGYETTSTALAFAAYLLATHPDIQIKVQDEIQYHMADKDPSYENIQRLKYLDMVLCETLRLFPVATSVINRQCMKKCEVAGLQIPVGVAVQADVWSLHHDSDIWGPDHESFDPERFSPENKSGRSPLGWMPFGAGPRQCIGLRFAMMEVKITLARVLRQFSLVQCAQTQVPLELRDSGTVSPKSGVTVRIVRREECAI